jgi:hypothetical protein
MDKMILVKELQVYFVDAKSFPEGVLEAHETLHNVIPFSEERRYFGISRPENGAIVYKAAAEMLENEQGKDYQLPSMPIKKGTYRYINIQNYMDDLQSIGEAFKLLISYDDIDPDGYCYEWYYNDKDVKCMVRLNDIN